MTPKTSAEVLKAARAGMDKAMESTKKEFSTIRTGKATTSLLDLVRVDAYGNSMPLNQVGSVAAPEARLLTITPWDKGLIKAIEKAISLSDLGITPSNDGALIRLTFPALTQERRKDLVKVVKSKAEDGRVAVRNVRRDIRQKLEKAEKEGDDLVRRIEAGGKRLGQVDRRPRRWHR